MWVFGRDEKERLYSFGKNEIFDNVKQKSCNSVLGSEAFYKSSKFNYILETKYLNSHNDLHSRPP